MVGIRGIVTLTRVSRNMQTEGLPVTVGAGALSDSSGFF